MNCITSTDIPEYWPRAGVRCARGGVVFEVAPIEPPFLLLWLNDRVRPRSGEQLGPEAKAGVVGIPPAV